MTPLAVLQSSKGPTPSKGSRRARVARRPRGATPHSAVAVVAAVYFATLTLSVVGSAVIFNPGTVTHP